MPEDKVKSRTRVVSLRITDDTYTAICQAAENLMISPSQLLTRIVSTAALAYRPKKD